MLNAKALALLKQVIATIPHDDRGAFKESDLIRKLAKDLPASCPDEDDGTAERWLLVAEKLVEEAMKDDGTPASTQWTSAVT
jgi:hypothetical protein